MDVESILNKKFGSRFKKDLEFKQVTTFGIGGKIKYFVYVISPKECVFLINFCKNQGIPCFVLGGGSNILASDNGFSGLVVSTLKMNKIKFKKNNVIEVQSGVRLFTLIIESAKKELGGLEWAIGIPGTVGGATIMNAGAFGGQVSDYVKSVTFYDGKSVRISKKDDVFFEYRSSIFKKREGIIILSVCFQLEQKDRKIIEDNIKNITKKRMNTQKVGYPSAGSVFKRLSHITAAEMIDKAGLKGTQIGGAMVSKVHSGYIVNVGGASCKDVQKLIDFISKSVYNKFTENLELEIILVGENDEQF